jgi:bacteriocin-like protein
MSEAKEKAASTQQPSGEIEPGELNEKELDKVSGGAFDAFLVVNGTTGESEGEK